MCILGRRGGKVRKKNRYKSVLEEKCEGGRREVENRCSLERRGGKSGGTRGREINKRAPRRRGGKERVKEEGVSLVC